MLHIIQKWPAGSIDVYFFEKNNVVCMGMLPAGVEPELNHRDNVDDSVASRNICPVMNISFKAFEPESMLQLKFSGDAWFGHSGADMRNSATCAKFRLVEVTLIIANVLSAKSISPKPAHALLHYSRPCPTAFSETVHVLQSPHCQRGTAGKASRRCCRIENRLGK